MKPEPNASPRQDPLTLEDVAVLADQGEPTNATTRHLGELVRSHPLFAERLKKLQHLALDAGVRRLGDGLLLNKEFDQLVQAQSWQHPAEVLDPEGFIGISYPELLHIAEARAHRAADPSALQAIKAKLAQAQADEREDDLPIQQVVARLRERQPGTAEKLLHEAIVAHQYKCREEGKG